MRLNLYFRGKVLPARIGSVVSFNHCRLQSVVVKSVIIWHNHCVNKCEALAPLKISLVRAGLAVEKRSVKSGDKKIMAGKGEKEEIS